MDVPSITSPQDPSSGISIPIRQILTGFFVLFFALAAWLAADHLLYRDKVNINTTKVEKLEIRVDKLEGMEQRQIDILLRIEATLNKEKR